VSQFWVIWDSYARYAIIPVVPRERPLAARDSFVAYMPYLRPRFSAYRERGPFLYRFTFCYRLSCHSWPRLSGIKTTAMTTWMVGVAIFYALTIAYLGFEMWRAPLVDDYGNVLQPGNTLRATLQTMRLRNLGS
jgi:hypothetical protein